MARGVAGISRLQKIEAVGGCLPSGAHPYILLVGDQPCLCPGPGPGVCGHLYLPLASGGDFCRGEGFWALSV